MMHGSEEEWLMIKSTILLCSGVLREISCFLSEANY